VQADPLDVDSVRQAVQADPLDVDSVRQAVQADPLDVDSVRQAAAFAEQQARRRRRGSCRSGRGSWSVRPAEHLAHDQRTPTCT
jgi:hypothetical protein